MEGKDAGEAEKMARRVVGGEEGSWEHVAESKEGRKRGKAREKQNDIFEVQETNVSFNSGM